MHPSLEKLYTAFIKLTQMETIELLARIAYSQTIHARATYVGQSDFEALKKSNEVLHRLSGYISRTSAPERWIAEPNILEGLLEIGPVATKELRKLIDE